MTYYFTADWHLHHPNQARRRGFSPETHGSDWLDQHDEAILAPTAALIKPTDTLVLGGDVGHGRPEVLEALLKRVPGKKVLVVGNHDAQVVKKLSHLFAEVRDLWVMRNPLGKAPRSAPDPRKPPLVMVCHYPMASWDRSHYGSWHLHGHSHGGMPPIPGRLDVGWDVHGKILRWEDLLSLFTREDSPHRPRPPRPVPVDGAGGLEDDPEDAAP